MWLLVAFIGVPLIEIALFIQVGGFIGLWPTLLIVVLTAMLGTYLVRSQGAMALSEVRSSFNDLRDPTEPLAHGAMILFSGALLLTPGFFTDAVGFALLVPQVRAWLLRRMKARMVVQGGWSGSAAGGGPRRSASDDVIEGSFEPADDSRRNGPSGWTRH